MDSSPDIWKQLSGWLWAALTVPIGILWKKADGAMQKEEVTAIVRDLKDVLKEHAERDEKVAAQQRETFLSIFEKMEQQGKGIERIETTLTFLREKH